MVTTTAKPLSETLSTERKKFLHMMFTAALEGGIGYWSECVSYRWRKPEFADADGYSEDYEDIDRFQAVIAPPREEGCWGAFTDERDHLHLSIDLEVMQRGAQRFLLYCHGLVDSQGQPVPPCEQKPLRDDHYWRQWLVQEATNGAEGDSDAEVADQIVQWGLFGKGVYG